MSGYLNIGTDCSGRRPKPPDFQNYEGRGETRFAYHWLQIDPAKIKMLNIMLGVPYQVGTVGKHPMLESTA